MAKTGSQSQSFITTATRVISLLFITLAAAWSLVIPSFESPDEMKHFDFIVHIIRERSLPVQQVGRYSEFHHPPVYYLVTAVIVSAVDLGDETGVFRANPDFGWTEPGEKNIALHSSAETFPFRGHALALHLARGVSVLMGATTVFLTIKIAELIFSNRPIVGLLAGALVAFNPQFLFISASVNNDNLLILAATGIFLQLLLAVKMPDQWPRWTAVGIWIAVGILAKFSAVVIGFLAGITLLGCAVWRRSWKLLVVGGLGLGLPVFVLAGLAIAYLSVLIWRVYTLLTFPFPWY